MMYEVASGEEQQKRNKVKWVERTETAKEGKIFQEWFYGATWTKVSCLFSATAQWSKQSIWGFFTLHVHVQHMRASQTAETMHILLWTPDEVPPSPRARCWTGFSDSLARMLWREKRTTLNRGELMEHTYIKRQSQTFIKWSIGCHRGSADVGSLTMSFSHPHSQ